MKKRILIATRNAHKVGEIKAILGDEFELLRLEMFPGAPEVKEDAPTFAGNATKKAVELAHWLSSTGQGGEVDFVMADDSGLEVDGLNGAPGVHSARFAALDSGTPGNSSDAENRAKLLRALANVRPQERTARFRCVIAITPLVPLTTENASPVCYADELELQTELADGTCEGSISVEPKGTGGFGYDPLFVPEGFKETFAEISEEAKNRISHRGKALLNLREQLRAV